MKRYLAILFVLLVAPVFSLDMEHSLQIYTQLVSQYNQGNFVHPFLSVVERELKNLSLYRYYRLLMAGSVDKREAMPDVGDYLGAIYDSVQVQDEDEQLAYSLFLSYLVARMNRTNLTTNIVMKNNGFVKFFSSYRDTLSKEARTFFAWIISYQIGLCEQKPPVDVEQITKLEADYVFQSPTNLAHLRDLSLFYSDLSVQQTLAQAVQRVVENVTKDPSRAAAHINREAAFVARDISKPVTTFQAQIAQKVIAVTPRDMNFWWIRFVVYAALIIIGAKYHRLLMVMLSLVASFEVFYILYVFDFLSPTESLFYGLLAVFGFLFSFVLLIRRTLSGKGFLQLAVFGVIVVVFLMPFVFNCDGLSMDRFSQLKESIYYGALKKELFQDELSRLSYFTRTMSSTLYVGMDESKKLLSEFADVLNKAQNMGAIEEITIPPAYVGFSSSLDFFSADNFDRRIALFSGSAKDLQSYLLDEKSRKSDLHSNYGKFSSYVDRIMAFSADYLRDDFALYLQDLFTVKYPILSSLLRKIPFDTYRRVESAKPNIPVSKEKTSLSIMLSVMIVFTCLVIFNSKVAILPSVVLATFALGKWFSMKGLQVFVEQGIPAIEVGVSGWVNPGIFVIAVVLVFLSVYEFLRKGEKVL
ncbi:MAG TPA: hypothetical protein PLP64_01600 [Pseudothermotoga sp.]|nr:hypothetical protein [Pseudothermotoga sp.]